MEVFDSPVRYAGTLSFNELAYWVAFSRVLGIGPVRFKLLLDYFNDDVEVAWRADSKALAQAGLDPKIIDSFLRQRVAINPQQEMERLSKYRIHVITCNDRLYPPLLKQIDHAPPVLYVAGTLSEADQFALGIVGTRNSSPYGRQVTERFATDLAAGQVTVVSGMALGIDTIAHTATLTTVVIYSPYPAPAPGRTACPAGRYRSSRRGARCHLS